MEDSKFDGLGFEVEKPFRMQILHPVSRQPLRAKVKGAKSDKNKEGEDTEVEAYIDLYSSDSSKAKAFDANVLRRRLGMKGKGNVTPEELDAEAIEKLAGLTASWCLVTLDGRLLDVECTPKNARELYANPGLAWLREQVDNAVYDRANLSKASSSN